MERYRQMSQSEEMRRYHLWGYFSHTCTLKHTQIQKGRLMPLMKAVKILVHALILNTPLLAEGLSMNTRWE